MKMRDQVADWNASLAEARARLPERYLQPEIPVMAELLDAMDRAMRQLLAGQFSEEQIDAVANVMAKLSQATVKRGGN